MLQEFKERHWSISYLVIISCFILIWYMLVVDQEGDAFEPQEEHVMTPPVVYTHVHNRKTVGLALGGGGARGIAHVGVIKALIDNNIQIDYIAGTSIGAIVGGLYADTLSTNKMEDVVYSNTWHDYLSLIDPATNSGLIRGDKIEAFIESNLESSTFNQLKIPLSVVTTDLQSGDTVVITTGNLAKAIRASASIPFVFQPVKYGEQLLVDAVLTEPLPVRVVRDMGADIVIAVDLNTGNLNATKSNSRGKFGLYGTSKRSFDIMQYHLAKRAKEGADIIITPNTAGVQWYEFANNESFITSGEGAMDAKMSKLKALLETR